MSRAGPDTRDRTNLQDLEKDVAKKKIENEKQLEEELNYLNFPSIMGWYFDGVFTEPFGLNEDFAVQFNELQAELDIVADYEQEETFTEKARRNFWPPKFFGCCFRGRGVYLDFLEIRKDPPHSPLEINYEPKHELIGVACDEDGKDDDDHHGAGAGDADEMVTGGRRRIIMKAADKTDPEKQVKRAKEDYYWDHYSGSFIAKTPDHDYYYDDNQQIWRSFVGYGRRTPYTFYFDLDEGAYRVRNRRKLKDYYWDGEQNVWKKYGQKGPGSSGLGPSDFYWDEMTMKWVPMTKRIGAIQDYAAGKRKIKRGTRGLSGRHEEDYYYDSSSGTMVVKDFSPKTSGKITEYYYDPWENKWREKNKDPQHVQGYHPSDYVWNSVSGAWDLRPEKERRVITPYDYFFDDSLGRFYPRQMPQREIYFWDKNLVTYRQNDVTGPSANGLNAADYCWDEDKLVWSLIESHKDDVEDQLTVKRKIIKGKRGRSGKVADDFFYDGSSGKFIPKEPLKFERYVFDPIEEVWRKDKQPYGPGRSGLYPDEYYFDQIGGVWRERSDNTKMRQPSEESTFHSAYDYYFDWESGKFMERHEHDRHSYTYDNQYHCFTKEAPVVKGKHKKNKKTPHDFYFDEFEEAWFAFEDSPQAREVEDYANGGGRRVRFGPRGENGLCSDDWYFDTVEEKFKEKHEGLEYEYSPGNGVWILPGTIKGLMRSKYHPDDHYFSDAQGVFKLKVKDDPGLHIYLDKNARIWREKRHKPFEYTWNEPGGFYILSEDAGKFTASGKKKKLKKPKGKKTTQEVMAAVNMDDYRPDWEHPKAEDMAPDKRGKYKDLKKPVSWTDPAYQQSEQRLHLDRPGHVEI